MSHPTARRRKSLGDSGKAQNLADLLREAGDAWVAKATAMSRAEWVSLIQAEIRAASRPSKDPQHDQTDPAVWVARVAQRVLKAAPTGDPPFDDNLRTAAVLGYVLLLWYFRCHRAKIYDPRRPVAKRKDAYIRWMAVAQAVWALPVDESQDGALFPGQKWESPFAWHATDGTFV